MFAVKDGELEMIKILIEKNANLQEVVSINWLNVMIKGGKDS
jgi:hypothetical protein